MLELFKILGELLIKVIATESIINAKKSKKLRKLGVDLFLMYSTLNSAIVLGRRILERLDWGVWWMKSSIREGEPRAVCCMSDVAPMFNRQLSLLRGFVTAFRHLDLETEVLSSEVAWRLVPIATEKMNALNLLSLAIERGKTRLVSLDEVKMRWLMEYAADPLRKSSLEFEMFDGLIIERGIADVSAIEVSQHPIVEAYLQSGKAKNDLDELERLAHLLRASIEKNFSVQDILLDVGDRRATLDGQSRDGKG